MSEETEDFEFETEEGREILKEPVVAFGVVVLDHDDKMQTAVTPISVQNPMDDALSESFFAGNDTKMIEIVPAQPGCYRIWVEEQPGTGRISPAGYEYPGASTQDWDAVAEHEFTE